METSKKMRLTAVMVEDHKGRGFTGFFKEFPKALAHGGTTDELLVNMFKSIEVLRKMNQESYIEKGFTNVSRFGSVKEQELELELAS